MKTNEEDFKEFIDECLKWIHLFGLLSWEIHFSHRNIKNDRAECEYVSEDRMATMRLGKNWGNAEPDPGEVRKVGFHEVCELLLSPLSDLCSRNDVPEVEVTKEVHVLIRILENVIWKKEWMHSQNNKWINEDFIEDMMAMDNLRLKKVRK